MLRRQAFMKHGFAVWSGTACHDKNSHFFIFSSYERSECFIAECNGDASYCGALAKQCFIVRLLWSTALPYEAHFVLASFARQASKYMKHRLTAVWSEAFSGFMFFCLNRIFFHDELFLSCKTIQCEQCCITNGKTFIFHLLIIRSVSGVLHSGMKWSCFIFAKANASSEKAVLRSTALPYEAALRAMKRTFGAWSEALTGFMFFCPKFGQKNGVADRTRTDGLLGHNQTL